MHAMKWTVKHKPMWKLKFAWLPTQVQGKWTWLEPYYERLECHAGDGGLTAYRRWPNQVTDEERRLCDDICGAAKPHVGTAADW